MSGNSMKYKLKNIEVQYDSNNKSNKFTPFPNRQVKTACKHTHTKHTLRSTHYTKPPTEHLHCTTELLISHQQKVMWTPWGVHWDSVAMNLQASNLQHECAAKPSCCLHINSPTYPYRLSSDTQCSLAESVNKGLLCPCHGALAKMGLCVWTPCVCVCV